ncbi:MAG: hypothetical protein V1853_03320 [bacterium]
MRVEEPITTEQPVKTKRFRGGRFLIVLIIIFISFAIVSNVLDKTGDNNTNSSSVLGERDVLVPVTITEKQINDQLTKAVPNQPLSSNQVSSVEILITSGAGMLLAAWDGGQTLTADVIVNENQKELDIENVEVTGTGFLDSFFEAAAKQLLDKAFDDMIEKNGEKLERIELQTGEVKAYFGS